MATKVSSSHSSYDTFPVMSNEQRKPLLVSDDEQNDNRDWNDTNDDDVEVVDQQPSNPHATSDLASLMHLMKGSIGTGLLGLPWAIKHAGILFGPLLLILMAFICVHCMRLLVMCSKHFCRAQGIASMDYSNVMKNAVENAPLSFLQGRGSAAATLVNVFLMITQLGFCCVYFVFMAQNIRQVLCKNYWPGAPSDRVFMLMILVPIILLSFIRHLKVLAWFSILANIATVVSLGIIFYYVFQGLPSISARPLIASPSNIPMFFGTAIYAFEGIGVILPIENEMKHPKHFPAILYLGMTVVSVLYVIMGTIGYLKYGGDIRGSITLNLQAEAPLSQAVKLMFSFVIGASYAIQFYVPMQILWGFVQRRFKPGRELFWQLILRSTFVVLTCLCAIAIPDLGDYISLIGAVSSSFLALVFPPVIHILTFYWPTPIGVHAPLIGGGENIVSKRMGKLILCKNILIVVFGLTGFVAGTIVSIQNIIKDLSSDSIPDVCSSGIFNLTTTARPFTTFSSAFSNLSTSVSV